MSQVHDQSERIAIGGHGILRTPFSGASMVKNLEGYM